MDSAAVAWLAEMELDNSIFTEQYCDLIGYSLDEEVVATMGQSLENCLPSSSTLINNTPPEFHKPNNSSSSSSKMRPPNNPNNNRRFTPISSDPIILSFGNVQYSSPQHEVIKKSKKKKGRPRLPLPTYNDHIIAERKRRELLKQRFLLLTTMVPGIKKMDQISVLEDTIKYMKQLQEREKILEEQLTKQIKEPAVLLAKESLPEIEARVCNNNILIRVHCEKQKGVLVNLLSNVENLKLIVVQTNVLNFGNSALVINITAEMEKEFKLTVEEIVKRLRSALQRGN